MGYFKTTNQQKMEKFIPENHGWISAKTPPENVLDVIVLIFNKEEGFYYNPIGFYENEWIVRFDETDNYDIIAWSPIPYHPNNF